MLHNNEFSVNKQLKMVEMCIQMFENSLNKNNLGIHFKFKISCGYERCMARIWDLKSGLKANINKRCCRTSSTLGLCKLHLKKNPHGRIDEHPSELNLITYYRDKIPNIEYEIDLEHKPYYIFKSKSYINKKVNLNLKNNNNYNSKMSLEIIDYKKTLDTIDKETLSSEDIATIITEKYGIKNITIGEKKEIIKNVRKFSKSKLKISKTKEKIVKTVKKIKIKYNKKALINSIKVVNLSELESIQLNDLEGGECEIYVHIFHRTNYVLNNHKKIVGTMREWIDEDGEVPEEYKTTDNLVLIPKIGLPMCEIIINKSGAMYCNIKEDIYREYNYNDELESFTKTNRFIRFE